MDQLHPLRDATLVDVFPILKFFKSSEDLKEDNIRQTELKNKMNLLASHRDTLSSLTKKIESKFVKVTKKN
jgi:hypothetical protein